MDLPRKDSVESFANGADFGGTPPGMNGVPLYEETGELSRGGDIGTDRSREFTLNQTDFVGGFVSPPRSSKFNSTAEAGPLRAAQKVTAS